MHGVYLDAVDAGLAQQAGGLAEGLGALLDLGHGQRAGLVVLLPAVRRGGGACAQIFGVHDKLARFSESRVVKHHAHQVVDAHGAAAARRQLHEQLGAGLVEVDHVLLELLKHALVGIEPAVAHDVAHPLHAGEYQADVVARSLQQEVSRFLVEVARLHPAEQRGSAHGTHDKAVLDLYIADFPRCK